MPLEVRQIGIRLDVGDGPSARQAPQDGLSAAPGRQSVDPADRAEIVEECVAAVLTALRMQGER